MLASTPRKAFPDYMLPFLFFLGGDAVCQCTSMLDTTYMLFVLIDVVFLPDRS